MIRILIADDEYLARSGLRSMLEELDLHVEIVCEATNGEEMARMASQYLPDIAFVDIRMPKLNGLEAIRLSRMASPHTHWLILSGFPEFDYAQEAIRLGVSAYLLKPVNPEELRKVLIDFIDANRKRLLNEAHKDEIQSAEVIDQVIAYIDRNYMSAISIGQIAERFYITPNYLSTLFHKKTGSTFMSYLKKIRLLKAKELLVEPNIQVQQVAERVGYLSVRHFARLFAEQFGCLPSKYRDQFKNR